MIEVTATMSIPREDEGKWWDDRKYREGLVRELAQEVAGQIMEQLSVRRIRDVTTKQTKVEARLLIRERESAVGGRMPLSIAEAFELGKFEKEKVFKKEGGSVVEVAMRVITMPDKKEAG